MRGSVGRKRHRLSDPALPFDGDGHVTRAETIGILDTDDQRTGRTRNARLETFPPLRQARRDPKFAPHQPQAQYVLYC
jgi:hypothetical protein